MPKKRICRKGAFWLWSESDLSFSPSQFPQLQLEWLKIYCASGGERKGFFSIDNFTSVCIYRYYTFSSSSSFSIFLNTVFCSRSTFVCCNREFRNPYPWKRHRNHRFYEEWENEKKKHWCNVQHRYYSTFRKYCVEPSRTLKFRDAFTSHRITLLQ